ncbi:exodeoxyribonuclease VII large subunit [Rickettsia endosymbiont of Cardiosporidium cionae]|uniref:exodeoxyribonuclease VII large subunit n=1 Tax=Rickettsia endosymbiont of Cardiosporidium cionae TaxID=2777155 RepID=UPI001895B9F8|nr:exodeoxyribonuclease VII large subunit [Rickettsia endosymbiont of Cardiosporidium cionae]KAF8818168.1 exodeoxyribonuclease VII large subunit [Rickettsia endosymbiont of Cardiosporidium cionae]
MLNIPEDNAVKTLSVTEVSNQIKWLLENNFSEVQVKGEISGIHFASSGHCYFHLKDNLSILSVIFWKSHLLQTRFELSDGLEVIVYGKISSYSGQSKYQLYAKSVQLAGIGDFIKLIAERKKRLEKEGLFDKIHKKKIPFLPKKIGIITSIKGSVIKDIVHRINARCPLCLLVWHIAVQGDTSESDITNAINGFNKIQDRPDLIIIARGGGTIEDLISFSSESVVRAAFHSEIPIISAIGHETDHSLLDLVADLRAPTPTAAAELAVPLIQNLKDNIRELYGSINSAVKLNMNYKQQIIDSYIVLSKYPVSIIENHIQMIDHINDIVYTYVRNIIQNQSFVLKNINLLASIPLNIINNKVAVFNQNIKFILHSVDKVVNDSLNEIKLTEVLLENFDIRKLLSRGFTLLKTPEGTRIFSALEAIKYDILHLEFFDGEIIVIPQSKK